jgi:hypothetical protein
LSVDPRALRRDSTDNFADKYASAPQVGPPEPVDLWQEREGWDVGGLDDAELDDAVAVVEGGDAVCVEPFGEGDDAGVGAAEGEVAVSAGE